MYSNCFGFKNNYGAIGLNKINWKKEEYRQHQKKINDKLPKLHGENQRISKVKKKEKSLHFLIPLYLFVCLSPSQLFSNFPIS